MNSQKACEKISRLFSCILANAFDIMKIEGFTFYEPYKGTCDSVIKGSIKPSRMIKIFRKEIFLCDL